MIPRLVVEYAADLVSGGVGYADLVDRVRESGNGEWPRTTLKRHVLAHLARPKIKGSICVLCNQYRVSSGQRRPKRKRGTA